MLNPVMFGIKRKLSVAISVDFNVSSFSKRLFISLFWTAVFYFFSYSKELLTDKFLINSFAQRVHFPAVLPASVTSSLAACSQFPLGCFPLSTLQLIHCVIAIACFFHSFCPAPRQFRFLKGFLKGVLP